MNKKIGIIGAGQLALMLIEAASKFGIECICLDPNPKACAFMYATKKIVADYSDLEALKKLEQQTDVIIYEFENIDLTVLKKIDVTKLYQGIEVLKYSKNRFVEKNLAKENKFNLPKYAKVTTQEELTKVIDDVGYPGILKTLEMGYDGKGQITINNDSDLLRAYDLLTVECIYEEKINFDFEMSLICVRDKKDHFQMFPPFINEHVNGILHKTDINSKLIESTIYKENITLVRDFMKKNNFYGILCVEFFVKDDKVYFNEMAPRPHNSGHITLDSTNVSQFEQMIRAALGYELIKPKIRKNMTMINVLGQNYTQALEILKTSNEAKVYIYGKDEAIENRKMGHVNLENEQLITKIDKEFKHVK